MQSGTKIQQDIFRILLLLVFILTGFVAGISIIVNVKSESRYLDQNLQNMAQVIANSVPVQRELSSDNSTNTKLMLHTYLDSLKESLSNIDVISVIGIDNVRRYHTNSVLIGSKYEGIVPQFEYGTYNFYVTSDIGPSGSQRRAYAAIYDENGTYLGFVIAVMLNSNIQRIIFNTIFIHLICIIIIILFAIILSKQLSKKIKEKLHGYEPDTFSAMFTIRENVLDSLEEGIVAVNMDEKIIYGNKAAQIMLGIPSKLLEGRKTKDILTLLCVESVLVKGEKVMGVSLQTSQGFEVLVDKIPVMEHDKIIGALCILRDRTEYIKLMEDLSGVRYMVDSMRANNHDFINKLHVILGLIQMGNIMEASEYIMHVTSIQQKVLHNIIKNIEDPSVAALLIGKYAQASELNIQFILKSGSKLCRNDISVASGDLVTIIGNLLDNAMDSMNEKASLPKDLLVGVFSKPNALLITVDDTGTGIKKEYQSEILKKGFTTKGESHGTGLCIVHNLIQKYGGTISIDSEDGVGTSITVTMVNNKQF